jgi:hypothetical protein
MAHGIQFKFIADDALEVVAVPEAGTGGAAGSIYRTGDGGFVRTDNGSKGAGLDFELTLAYGRSMLRPYRSWKRYKRNSADRRGNLLHLFAGFLVYRNEQTALGLEKKEIHMENKNLNMGSLAGGILLVLFGGLALLAQLIPGFDFWGDYWPFIIIGVGLIFFAGMFAGGRSTAPLAIPGAIIVGVGLLLFLQNLTNHWESWAYGWTVIIMSVGAGIYIMGAWNGDEEQRDSGLRVLRIGVVLFVIFGAFFEMIFNSSQLAQIGFPIALIALGAYILLTRSGLRLGSGSDAKE